MCVWYTSKLVTLFMSGPLTLAYCSEVVLLATHTVCLTKCWALPLHEWCTTVFSFLLCTLFCSSCCHLSAVLVSLSLCIWSKSVMLFMSYNAFFCNLCASTLLAHICTCWVSTSCIFFQATNYFYDFLCYFCFVYAIYELLFEPSIMFFIVTFHNFCMESAHALLCGLIIFSL